MKNNINLEVSSKDKAILIQVLQVPLHAFGINDLLEKTNASKEDIESILKKIKNSKNNYSFLSFFL